MKTTLKNLSYPERVKIKTLLGLGFNQTEIANKLGRNKSSISRELKKWVPDKDYSKYDPQLAYWYSKDRIGSIRRRECKLNNKPKLLSLVKGKLKKRWSPQQIANWLKRKYPMDKSMNISHESIYKYIYTVARGQLKKELVANLRYQKSKRKSPVGSRKHKGKITDRISIDSRPEEVDKRIVPGHWESDLIIGKDHKSCIGTLVERTTRFAIIVPLKNKTASVVRKAFARELKKLPKELTKTLTHDNGLEMAQHKLFTKQTDIQVYFCHPYSSWERATNENTNGLIRDFWPKGTDFNTLSKYQIKKVQTLLNERPRKVLNWFSPAEVFFNLIENQN